MNETSKAIANLIARHLSDELNDQEKQELNEWVQQSEDHQQFFRQLTNEETLGETLAEYNTSKGIVLDKIKEAIVVRKRAVSYRWIAVAASILLIAGAVVWWSIVHEKHNSTPATAATAPQDRQPASEGAVLKLADGKEIILDNAHDGAIATQGNTQITKQGGLLSYNSSDPTNAIQYNTLSTAKGKIYKLLLPDGSKVWLNAASSIRFPTVFTGWQRSVEVTGEVYLEVKKDTQKPFHVTVNQRATIDVLGTSFNVNAYDNEAVLRTTLLEGSVKFVSENAVVLTPGQQAVLSKNDSRLTVVDHANVKAVMGWKDGFFTLDDLTLEELMRDVERWYDVEVAYEKGIPRKAFFGKVDRNLSLLDFMDGLKAWGVRFRLEEKKLIITGVQ